MKKTLLLSALMLAFSTVANAQVAVVDTQYILENAKITKKANDQMLELTKAAKTQVEKQETALAKKQQELLNKKAVLSADVYAQKQEALKQEILTFKRNIKKEQAKLGFENRNKKKQIADVISQVVEKIAKEKGYDVVVSKSFLMYSKESVEITQEVLKQVDKKELPKQ